MSASEPIMITVLPDKGYYRPGDTVRLTVRASAGQTVRAEVMYLLQPVTTLEGSLNAGEVVLEWTPPPDAPRGYGVDVAVLNENGVVVAALNSAFDVLNHWVESPRYGFFSDFSAARLTDTSTDEWLVQHHINGVQFYDWQYRWEDLLPETERFEDGLGRPQSMVTIRRLIDLLHSRGIAAMPYTAIYGASAAFYRGHPEWGFFDARGSVYDFGENSFIAIMNPAPGSPWNSHLMGEFADVLQSTGFDGIHIDQYGSPKTGYDVEGNPVDLAEVMPQFINQTAEVVQGLRGDEGVVLFNCVGNWPINEVAASEQEAAYIEVWSPNDDYLDLNRIIVNAEREGNGKPVILAAYIPPERTINWRLANSVILASGGTHLETGEPESMLADPYFPRFGRLAPDQQPSFRRYYDFQVRYENVLSTVTTAGSHERERAVDLGEIRTGGIRSQGRVVPIVRAGEGFDTFNLINFVGMDNSSWNEAATTTPSTFRGLPVRISVTQDVASVWYASPDEEATMRATELAFTVENGVLMFTLPSLQIWNMIVVEYTDVR